MEFSACPAHTFCGSADSELQLVTYVQPAPTVPKSEYDRIMETNVTPLYHSAAIIAPYFQRQHRGVFVNISSISAPRPRPGLVWYAGSKGAVSAVTKGERSCTPLWNAPLSHG